MYSILPPPGFLTEILNTVLVVNLNGACKHTRPCFTPVLRPFSFDALYKFTLLPNLRPVIFGLKRFSWFISISF